MFISISPKLWRRTINKNKDAFSVLKILRVLKIQGENTHYRETTTYCIHQHTERKHLESVELQGYMSVSSCQLLISLVAWLLHPSYKEE
jgi:hypothetical protein